MRPTRLLLVLLAACAAPPPAAGPVLIELHAPAWVGNPTAGWDVALAPAVLHATGRAPLAGDRAAAAVAAETDARGRLAAALRPARARLSFAWRALHASDLAPAALDALAADDAAAQGVITTALAGARLKGQWADDEAFWVWLELDVGAQLLPAFEADLSARLAALARELTPADHAALVDELIRFVAERRGR